MIKQDIINNPNSCLNKAADDEPLFILRSTDELSPKCVRDWACRLLVKADETQKTDAALAQKQREKAARAFEDAGQIEAYQARHGKKVPD